jgi:hypothetical protein
MLTTPFSVVPAYIYHAKSVWFQPIYIMQNHLRFPYRAQMPELARHHTLKARTLLERPLHD